MFCIQASSPRTAIATIEAATAPRPNGGLPEKTARISEIAPIAGSSRISQTAVKKIQLRCCQ